mmetsp:Transcript_31783/g.72539  ORF Transcript_31783/g.72539 Transcript_31783/m.72539 type:complete len:214 (+) Transcript_31783:3465-4106(+)
MFTLQPRVSLHIRIVNCEGVHARTFVLNQLNLKEPQVKDIPFCVNCSEVKSMRQLEAILTARIVVLFRHSLRQSLNLMLRRAVVQEVVQNFTPPLVVQLELLANALPQLIRAILRCPSLLLQGSGQTACPTGIESCHPLPFWQNLFQLIELAFFRWLFVSIAWNCVQEPLLTLLFAFIFDDFAHELIILSVTRHVWISLSSKGIDFLAHLLNG